MSISYYDFQANWIKADIQLPRRSQHCIVACYNTENHYQIHVSKAEYWGLVNGKPRWSGHKKVLYWMPLPGLPKGLPDTCYGLNGGAS